MRIAYLECFSGISGDMFLGALVDVGVSPQLLQETVAALGLGAKLEVSRVVRSGISATKVDVWVDGEKDMPREEYWAKQEAAHSHEHHDHHGHEHEHADHHSHGESSRTGVSAPHTHQHRGLTEIRKIISAAKISESAKKTAVSIFEALGSAEAKIHDVPIESITFTRSGLPTQLSILFALPLGLTRSASTSFCVRPSTLAGEWLSVPTGHFPSLHLRLSNC